MDHEQFKKNKKSLLEYLVRKKFLINLGAQENLKKRIDTIK